MQRKEHSEQQSNNKMAKLDFEIGDVVRIDGISRHYNGKIGTIIGIRLITSKSGKPMLAYTVKLSDVLAKELDVSKILFVR